MYLNLGYVLLIDNLLIDCVIYLLIQKSTYDGTMISICCLKSSGYCHENLKWENKAVVPLCQFLCRNYFQPHNLFTNCPYRKSDLCAHWALLLLRGRRAVSTHIHTPTRFQHSQHTLGEFPHRLLLFAWHQSEICIWVIRPVPVSSQDPLGPPSWCSLTSGGRSPRRWDLSAMPPSSMRR